MAPAFGGLTDGGGDGCRLQTVQRRAFQHQKAPRFKLAVIGRARGKGQHFSLVSVSQPVIAVLELARLDRVFPIFESLDLAAQS